jgi:NTP pyrophosphatase (non-canonical NTP hydrolase)
MEQALGGNMNECENIKRALRTFSAERDWDQFHNGKDLSLALSIEAAELLEAFLWKKPENVDPEKVREELADVFLYAFMIADKYGLDVSEICHDKMKRNALKYPVEKARGIAKKYSEL